MISGAQIRAARALLGISASDLAQISGVGHRTLQRFEATDGIPDARTAVLQQLIMALEGQGIVFQGDPIELSRGPAAACGEESGTKLKEN